MSSGPFLSGDSSNVYVNDGNLVVLNDKAIYATDAVITGSLTVPALTLPGDLTVSGTTSLASASVTGTLSSGAATLASATVNGAVDINSTADISDTLTLSKGSGIALNVPDGSASIGGSLTVNGDLNVTGSVTAIDTVNLRVDDPITEFGSNVTNTTDTGLIFARSAGEGTGNVALFYDVVNASGSKLKLGYTLNSAADSTAISTTGALPVEIVGSLEVSGGDLVVNTSGLVVDTSNNKVGINTAAPTKALEVTGDAKVSANVYVTRIFFN